MTRLSTLLRLSDRALVNWGEYYGHTSVHLDEVWDKYVKEFNKRMAENNKRERLPSVKLDLIHKPDHKYVIRVNKEPPSKGRFRIRKEYIGIGKVPFDDRALTRTNKPESVQKFMKNIHDQVLEIADQGDYGVYEKIWNSLYYKTHG